MWRTLIKIFIVLVRVARLLLRHSVQAGGSVSVPTCISHVLRKLDLSPEELVWHELYLFRTVDGLIQGYGPQQQRLFLAWADMGEVFRIVHYTPAGGVRHYQVTVTPHIWEPLCAEPDTVRSIEQSLELDTTMTDCVSKTFTVKRRLENGYLIEERESRSRPRADSDQVWCSTEERMSGWNNGTFLLERKIWWEGDKLTAPRTEHELQYDCSGNVYKRIQREVDAKGDAIQFCYIADTDKPIVTKVQRYHESSGSLRHRRTGRRRQQPQSQITDLGQSTSYPMPEPTV